MCEKRQAAIKNREGQSAALTSEIIYKEREREEENCVDLQEETILGAAAPNWIEACSYIMYNYRRPVKIAEPEYVANRKLSHVRI